MAADRALLAKVVVIHSRGGAPDVLLLDTGWDGELVEVRLKCALDHTGRMEREQARLLEGGFEGTKVLAKGELAWACQVVDLLVRYEEAIVNALNEGGEV